jgi:hypothetical protein
MRKLLPLLVGGLAAAATVTAAPAAATPRGEAELARMLEGRVAGEPVDCVNLRQVRSTQVIDDTAIVYQVGRTLYVNRPRNPDALDRWDTQIVRPFNSRLCSVDTVQTVQPGTRMFTGIVFLGEFVPYEQTDRD